MPGALFGVPHHARTLWQPDPHPHMYKVAQPEVAAWPCTWEPGTALLAPKRILAPSSQGSAWQACWNHRALL